MSDDFTGVIESIASGDSSAGSPPASAPEPSESRDSTDQPSASATATSPAEPATAPETTEGQAVPYARFREVNERGKQLRTELESLSWAKSIPTHAAPVITQFYEALQADPIGTLLREVEGMMTSDPSQAQAVRSAAARWMGQGQQAPADADPMPEADYQNADGTPFYSAQQSQRLVEWRDRRAQEQFGKTMQPLQQWAAAQQAKEIRAEITQHAQQYAQTTFAQWKDRPYFMDHKAEIADRMEQGMGIADAYADVLQTHVFPKIQHSVTGTQVATMQRKADAGTINPGRGPAHGQKRPSSFSEAMAQLVAQ